ncbi:MAG TPA: serine hydrolase domain-containing protein [Acidimicrobiales bacterium]|nr:serine hydrolase domain-containing protein [Acidimicrobiales bacterium]
MTHPRTIGARSRTALTLVGSLLVLSLVLSACSSSSVGTRAGNPGTFSTSTQSKLSAVVAQFLGTTRAPGVLVAIHSPEGNWVSGQGLSNLSTSTPLQPWMQYKIGSQTKAFTATLILQLVGEGRLSLDDDIARWVPGVPNGQQITIRQLLNHTSGLGDVLSVPAIQNKLLTGCTVTELLAAGATAAPIAAPGTKWVYSNYGYDLLGRVAELVTGTDLSTLIRRRIAQPLGLQETDLPVSGTGLEAPYAHGYAAGATQAPTKEDDATPLPQSCLWAAGGMDSDMSDMTIWSQALATGALIKPKVWKEAQADQVPVSIPQLGRGSLTWGLGFIASGGFIGHQGGMPGYETISMYSPALRASVVLMTNKQFNAIPPMALFHALALTAFGHRVHFGVTVGQALEPLDQAQLNHIPDD